MCSTVSFPRRHGKRRAGALPNVSSRILAKVIEYCKYCVAAKKENESEQKVKEFNSAFVKVDQATLFEIILAANYLNMSGLLDLTCMTVANMMREGGRRRFERSTLRMISHPRKRRRFERRINGRSIRRAFDGLLDDLLSIRYVAIRRCTKRLDLAQPTPTVLAHAL